MKKHLVKCTIITFFTLIIIASNITSAHAVHKYVNTDRGRMDATMYTRVQPNSKYVDYGSIMENGNHTRLYLKATTLEYLSGKERWSVPRFGGAGRTFIMDYYYVYGTVNIDLRTYTTHEAIWTNAHSVMLELKH